MSSAIIGSGRGLQLMSSLLESLAIDIHGLLGELRMEWINSSRYDTNPNAFSKIKTSGGNIMMCCPFHSEGNPSFGVLKDYPYSFNCFGCGESGSLYQLIAKGMGFTTEVHAEYYLTKNWLVLKPESRPALDIDAILDSKRDLEGRQILSESVLDSFKGKRHPYLYSRGFSERTLTAYEVGYNPSTDSMCVPVRTAEGHIRFIQSRSVSAKVFDNAKGVYKKDIIFGIFYLLRAKGTVDTLYLTESATDTMACYQSGLPAGALLGKSMSKEQVQLLLRSGVRELNLLLDNDSWGLKGSYAIYQMLKDTPIRVNLMMYPDGHYGYNTDDEEDTAFKDANALLLGGKLRQIEKVPFELSGIKWSKFI